MKKVAILGASYLQMPLVLKCKSLGLQTHCFAWEEGAVCKPHVDFFYPVSTLEKEKILKICREIKIDAILSIASDIVVPTINYVASNLGLISNYDKDSEASTNKFMMRQRFQQNNISSPKFLKVDKNFSDKKIKNLAYPIIVKPVDRSGSRGVQKIEAPKEISNAIFRACKESFINECIVEEFIDGIEVSVESISWEGKHFILAITDKVTTGEPYFVEIAHHQPSELTQKIQEKIKFETHKVLNALNIKYGASHSEFKITNDGVVFVIEVGARMGGGFIGSHLVMLSTGYDFLKGVIEVALNKFNEPIHQFQKYSGVYFLCKETEHLKQIIENPSQYKEIVAAEIINKNLHSARDSSDRSGYFIYQGEKRYIY